MSSDSPSVADDLNQLVEKGALTQRALQTITGIDAPTLHAVSADRDRQPAHLVGADRQHLTTDENLRLSVLTAQLTDGMAINDDDRLTGIIESLTAEAHLDIHNIAVLTGLDESDLKNVLTAPQSATADVKYKAAIRCSYLINAINLARRR